MRSTLITPTPAQQARLRSGQGGAICATAGAISERATDDGKCGRYYGFRSVPISVCTASTSFWRTVLIRPNSWRVSYASVGSSVLGSESRRPLRGLRRRSDVARRSSFMLSHIARAVPPFARRSSHDCTQ